MYLAIMLLTFFSGNSAKYVYKQDKHKVTIVGIAIVIKNDAAVQTDDSLVYYLDGIFDWGDEYEGKRVKVTGKLYIKEYHEQKINDPKITAIPQRQYGKMKFIKHPKWSLVE